MRLASPALAREDRVRHAIFFALYPPAACAAEIMRLADRQHEDGGLRGRRVARAQLHISLNNLGNYQDLPEASIAHVCAAMVEVAMPPFVLALNRITSFDTRNGFYPRVLTGDDGLIGIIMLYQAIHAVLDRAGVGCGRPRQIQPHLTLSRETSLLPERAIEPIVWRVAEFHLIHSLRGASRHHHLARWPLAGRSERRLSETISMKGCAIGS